MKLTLNIGLAPSSFVKSTRSFDKRLKDSLGFCMDNFKGAYIELRRDLPEPTLVVTGQFSGHDYVSQINALALQTEQDCIAVEAESESATFHQLIGPRAESWAPFDHAYFHRPSRRIV